VYVTALHELVEATRVLQNAQYGRNFWMPSIKTSKLIPNTTALDEGVVWSTPRTRLNSGWPASHCPKRVPTPLSSCSLGICETEKPCAGRPTGVWPPTHVQPESVLGHRTQPKPWHSGAVANTWLKLMMRVFVWPYKWITTGFGKKSGLLPKRGGICFRTISSLLGETHPIHHTDSSGDKRMALGDSRRSVGWSGCTL